MFRYVKFEGDELLESTVSGETAAKLLLEIVRQNAMIVRSLCSVIAISEDVDCNVEVSCVATNDEDQPGRT